MTFSITQKFLVNNDCYKTGRKITPKGIMVHSTGANNKKLSRYVQPDDGVLGKNPYTNDWNRGGITKCVHAFIGEDKNGDVRCYQTLPWNHRGWHGGGKSNDTHIGFEICEDGLNDRDYFNKVYEYTVELCVYLCKQFNLTEKNIIDHSEGYKMGIATNHGDVMHWFPRHGKSMDTLRNDVKDKLNTKVTAASTQPNYTLTSVFYNNNKITALLENGVTYVQLRELSDLLEISLAYDEQSKTVTFNGMIVNPLIIEGRSYMKVREIAEALGKSVVWDGKSVHISDK